MSKPTQVELRLAKELDQSYWEARYGEDYRSNWHDTPPVLQGVFLYMARDLLRNYTPKRRTR